MNKQLEFIDALVAEGYSEFTFADAVDRLQVSPTATANALRRLQNNGFVCRLSRGNYAIRPLGALGTSAVVDDLPRAVSAAFGSRPHRIAYLSALGELGLLTHPVRDVTVACATQVRLQSLGGRPVRSIIEREETLHDECIDLGSTRCSSLERAIVESAVRVDLTGGIDRLAEALMSGLAEADHDRMASFSAHFGHRGNAAERRIASLASVLGLSYMPKGKRPASLIRLDPREASTQWIDEEHLVAWHLSADEVRASIGF